MAHYNQAFAADEYDRMDTSLDDYVEPQSTGFSDNSSAKPQPKPSGSFMFIDFCPEYRRKTDSWFFQADYQTFSEIFHKVNEWLESNPKWEVKTAETLIYDSTTGFGQRLPFFAGKQIKRNLRAVRLWLIPRLHQRSSPQKIGCINVVPRIKITNSSGTDSNSDALTTINNDKPNITSQTQSSFLSTKPIYESLDEMLVRVNELLENKPINGRILSVETVAIPVECSNNWSVDTESSYWSDECQKNNNTIHILRIYFEYGSVSRERLEIIDFVPKVEIWDAPLAVPIYESFASLLTRSSQWLREQAPGLRFLSAHTVEAPLDYAFNTESIKENINSGNNSIDSRKMFFPNTSTDTTTGAADKPNPMTDEFSLKFLRLSVTRPHDSCPESHFPPTRESVVLNCKIFVPTKLPNHLNGNSGEYETVNQSKRKIEAWLMTTGARILSAETSVISIPFSSSSIATSVDSSLKSNSSVLGHYLTIYRIYLDGHYLEPPARLLPNTLTEDSDQNQNDLSNCSLM